MGPHVFGDGRLGLWVVNPANLPDRLPKIRAFAGGAITDLFLPESASAADFQRVRAAGFLGAHLWAAVDGRTALQYAEDVLRAITRTKAGAADLNVELSTDAALEPYMRLVVNRIRLSMPSRRLRLNIAFRKGGFLPLDLLASDPNLYVAEQNYVDPPGSSMVPTSAADALLDLIDVGVPLAKASVCYGAAGPVGGNTGTTLVVTLPLGWRPRRGVVFQDDLLVDAGLL